MNEKMRKDFLQRLSDLRWTGNDAELTEEVTQLETTLNDLLDGKSSAPFPKWMRRAVPEIEEVRREGRKIRPEMLKGLDLRAEELPLAVLTSPQLDEWDLVDIGEHWRTTAVTTAITRHPACSTRVYTLLAERLDNHTNRTYRRLGRQKALWDSSPYGAAAVVLALLPTRRLVQNEKDLQWRIERLGSGGYVAVETFEVLLADALNGNEQWSAEEDADDLIEKAILVHER